MAQQIQLRRGTAAAWTSANPTLAAGEAGYETDTHKLKFGDGTTAWTSLGYSNVVPAGGTANQALVKVDGTDYNLQWSTVASSDATLTFTDITTNNVSTTKHGFAPKAPNDATKFLDGTGTYSTPVSGGTPGGSNTYVQFNDSSAFGGSAAWVWDKTNNKITLAQGAITTSQPQVYSVTFNAGGVSFVGKSNDYTHTASASGTVLERWREGGSTVVAILKGGLLNIPYGSSSGSALTFGAGDTRGIYGGNGALIFTNGAGAKYMSTNGSGVGCIVTSNGVVGWASSTDASAGPEVGLGRVAANIAEVNTGTLNSYVGSGLVLGPMTVAQLPAAASNLKGMRATVSDATAPTFLAALTGGGAVVCPAFCNGSAWVAG